MPEQERIICAAINHASFGVICCYRHNDLYENRRNGVIDGGRAIEGFITTDNGRFVNREEAWLIADASGQIINRDHGIIGTLFSENLY